MVKIAPSILSADFSKLGEDIREIVDGGADWVHVDIMDGHFVPNISFGPPVLRCVRRATKGFLDVHLMISQPEKYLQIFLDCGSDLVNLHLEAEGDKHAMLKTIRQSGKMAALTIKPATPAEALFPYLEEVDMVLVMSVEPGFGGQSFMPASLDKVKALKAEIARRSLDCLIEIDGGINLENAPAAVAAGCDILVAGSSVYGAPDRAARIAEFKKVCAQ